MITWTVGGYTATWDGSGRVTVTITATGQLVLSYAASTFQGAISAPELQAILAAPPLSSNDLQLKATTGIAGFALQNATPTVLSWTAPNDGNLHSIRLTTFMHVTSLETGGAVTYSYFTPDNSLIAGVVIYAAGASAGFPTPANVDRLIAPGSLVTIQQSTALTAGAALLWCQIWAS